MTRIVQGCMDEKLISKRGKMWKIQQPAKNGDLLPHITTYKPQMFLGIPKAQEQGQKPEMYLCEYIAWTRMIQPNTRFLTVLVEYKEKNTNKYYSKRFGIRKCGETFVWSNWNVLNDGSKLRSQVRLLTECYYCYQARSF